MAKREHCYGRDKGHDKEHGRSRAHSGRCRIIAGRFRGRIIHFDDAEGLRPTTDRIRETVFNWLQPSIAGRRCLDAFAGSGALGFEALSRGASHVTFVENSRQSVDRLRSNVAELLADSASQYVDLIHDDVMSWLAGPARQAGIVDAGAAAGFDLVFLDPPYRSGLLAECCRRLHDSGCLSPDAIIYVEHAVEDDVAFPQSWSCIRHKQTASIAYGLYVAGSQGSSSKTL